MGRQNRYKKARTFQHEMSNQKMWTDGFFLQKSIDRELLRKKKAEQLLKESSDNAIVQKEKY